MAVVQSIGFRRPIGLLLACLAIIVVVAEGERTFNVLGFISQSISGRPISNTDVVASYIATVLAMKHFNERNSTVLKALSRLGRCDARLALAGGGLIDDQVLSSVAMSHLIRTVANETVDFINGPASADVSLNNATNGFCNIYWT